MYKAPTVTGRQPGLQSMVWGRRKKEIFNQSRMNKPLFLQKKKKNEKRLRNLWDNLKCSNIKIIGV